MQHHTLFSKRILSAAALLVLAGSASAQQDDWREIEGEIESCVATLAAHVNYDDATRVVHDVVSIRARTVGHKLTIETSIYTESAENANREYATTCVVNGTNPPMQFAISESFNGA